MAIDFSDPIRASFDGRIVCEPHHPSWFTQDVNAMLSTYRAARVMAGPGPAHAAAAPGGYAGLTYRRLHGSPRIYYSAYPPDYLDHTARQIQGAPGQEHWCIFDNTALGEATLDALALQHRLAPGA